ncbi:MAG: class I SAM-dependent methyltransferase [Cyanobacteria bacterium P01_D01_bin.105]
METLRRKDYPNITHLSQDRLQENSSLAKIINLVGEHKKVIDFGCATGYLAKLLQERGCKTTGIELNPDAASVAENFCERVIVADLDYDHLQDLIGEEKFEVAVFGDVLEHLKDPWQLLVAAADILTPAGYIVASVPNIAHGSIRLALLYGEFQYQKLGILDNTHLRFFTRDSLYQMFETSGYCIESEDNTKLSTFNESELTPTINESSVSDEVISVINRDSLSECFQFVVRAYPLSSDQGYKVLESKYLALKKQSNAAALELEEARSHLERTQRALETYEARIVDLQAVIRSMENSVWERLRRNWHHLKKVVRK